MFIELIDHLRCPRVHDESWLVASWTLMTDRHVVEGTLGCPVCRSEYRVHGGVADFTGGVVPDDAVAPSPGAAPATPDARDAASDVDADVSRDAESDALRIAALLDLVEPAGFTVLHGALGTLAPLVRRATDVLLLLVDPPSGVAMGGGLSGIRAPRDGRWPLASASAFAAALGASAGETSVAEAARVVRAGGRVLASVARARPASLTEIARDDRQWVAEVAATTRTSGVIPLRRR